MAVERRLVRDDQVFTRGSGALDRIERSHHRDCDARHGRTRISGLERIDGRSSPRYTHILLDTIDHRLRGQPRFLRGQR